MELRKRQIGNERGVRESETLSRRREARETGRHKATVINS